MKLNKQKALFVLSGGKRHSDEYEYPNSLITFFDEALFGTGCWIVFALVFGSVSAALSFILLFLTLLVPLFLFLYVTTMRKRGR